MDTRSLVSIVDDDESVRESLPDLLREIGFAVLAFSSAKEFLDSNAIAKTNCLLLDIAMPGMSGLDLKDELIRRHFYIPVVFITAHADESIRPHVLRQGAIECLFKPFTERALIDAIDTALRNE